MMTISTTFTPANNSFKTTRTTNSVKRSSVSSSVQTMQKNTSVNKNASSCLLENRITTRKRNSILSKTTTRLNVVSANASSSSFEQEQNDSAADVFVSEMESSQIVSSPKNKSKLALVATTAALSLSAFAKPAAAAAAAAIAVNAGDTAWILTSSALVLFMTIPGLAAFYAGLVKRKNLITVLGQCFALTCMMTIIWFVCGYSMCFSTAGLFGTAAMKEGATGLSAFIGGLDKMFLAGVGPASMHETIPEILWVLYQCTFAIITPALMVGSMVERMKFNAVMWYCALWSFAVYFPACHMVWGGGGGYFADLGVLDFAGGIVVHITAGIGALVAAIKVGKRKEMEMTVGNLVLTFLGTAMLWVGWFGFNGGSALSAGANAAFACMATQIAAATAAVTWTLWDIKEFGKASVLGTCTASIAGLATITPMAGFIGPKGAFLGGIAAGIICRFFSTTVKEYFGYDDALDVFGVHGVGGFLGTIMLGILCHPVLGGFNDVPMLKQTIVQVYAAVATAVYTAVASYACLLVTEKITDGLRVPPEAEASMLGLDEYSHKESAYSPMK
jgi:ammonium transporter